MRHIEALLDQWAMAPTHRLTREIVETFVKALELILNAETPSLTPEDGELLCWTWLGILTHYRKRHAKEGKYLYAQTLKVLEAHGLFEYRLYIKIAVEQGTRTTLWWCLQQLPYRQYLQTRHWQALRETGLQHSGYRCQVCNGQGPLHVHHRTYERLGHEHPTDLLVLCAACHELFHTHGKLTPPPSSRCSIVYLVL
jgi:hypothetical protein